MVRRRYFKRNLGIKIEEEIKGFGKMNWLDLPYTKGSLVKDEFVQTKKNEEPEMRPIKVRRNRKGYRLKDFS